MHNENLKPPESVHGTDENGLQPDPTPLGQTFSEILTERETQLEEIRPLASRKLLFQLEEKLNDERRAFEKLLGMEASQKDRENQYTYVLDPDYFEQQIMEEIHGN